MKSPSPDPMQIRKSRRESWSRARGILGGAGSGNHAGLALAARERTYVKFTKDGADLFA
jgi:hypothetical protein